MQPNKHFKQVPFGQGRQKLRFFHPLSGRYSSLVYMRRIFILAFLFLTPVASAVEVDALAGQGTSRAITKNCIDCEFSVLVTPLELYNENSEWAPTTSLVLFSEDQESSISIGLRFLDGRQALTSYVEHNLNGENVLLSAVDSNLSLNTPYLLGFEVEGETIVIFKIGNNQYTIDIGFFPYRVAHGISSMRLEVNEQ